MIPAASLFLMLPFFVTSAIVESWVLRKLWPAMLRRRIRITAWLANGLSYTVLVGYAAIRLHQAWRIRA
jgi:hypothetical protein